MTRPERADRASSRSLAGLDIVNVLMADVQNGVGPYLAGFLAGAQHWKPAAIGVAMAASTLAAAFCQIPAGMLVDSSRHKRALTAVSAFAIALGCVLIAAWPQFLPVIGAQIMLGAASAVVPPAIAALSLGLVGRNLIDGRISRNESFNHAGSFVAAALAGLAGHYLGQAWIFWLVCLFAAASAVSLRVIRPDEIDHDRARGGEDAQGGRPLGIAALLRRHPVPAFLAAVVLFHLGNAAMLPFAGQEMAKAHPGSETMALSACVIVAQLVMVGAAWGCGWAMRCGIGRKAILLIAFAILPVRGVLFTLFAGPMAVVGIQLLDGVAAGVFSVISVVVAADLTRGTGRFNLMQGLVALCVGIGSALSNMLGGVVVQAFGYQAGFLGLTAVACGACVFFLTGMVETRPQDETPDDAARAPDLDPSPAAA